MSVAAQAVRADSSASDIKGLIKGFIEATKALTVTESVAETPPKSV
jgi:hypothetical protein